MAYSWTTPVVNREDGSERMATTDMNRITQNVGYLQEQVYGSATISKTSWYRNDFIEKSFWETMLTLINDLAETTECNPRQCTNKMHYENINEIERWLLDVYNKVTGVTMQSLTDSNGNALTDHNLNNIEIPSY